MAPKEFCHAHFVQLDPGLVPRLTDGLVTERPLGEGFTLISMGLKLP